MIVRVCASKTHSCGPRYFKMCVWESDFFKHRNRGHVVCETLELCQESYLLVLSRMKHLRSTFCNRHHNKTVTMLISRKMHTHINLIEDTWQCKCLSLSLQSYKGTADVFHKCEHRFNSPSEWDHMIWHDPGFVGLMRDLLYQQPAFLCLFNPMRYH